MSDYLEKLKQPHPWMRLDPFITSTFSKENMFHPLLDIDKEGMLI